MREITDKYCEPCTRCIFQVYFSLFQNQHLDDAEYLEYDLLDLEEFINPRDIYNDPPDIPLAFRIDISKLDLQKILYPMGSRYPVEA